MMVKYGAYAAPDSLESMPHVLMPDLVRIMPSFAAPPCQDWTMDVISIGVAHQPATLPYNTPEVIAPVASLRAPGVVHLLSFVMLKGQSTI